MQIYGVSSTIKLLVEALFSLAIIQGDSCLFGSTLSSDFLVEPKRVPLIFGMMEIKEVELETSVFAYIFRIILIRFRSRRNGHSTTIRKNILGCYFFHS